MASAEIVKEIVLHLNEEEAKWLFRCIGTDIHAFEEIGKTNTIRKEIYGLLGGVLGE